MVGTLVTRRADGDAFRVVGRYGGQFVLGPLVHGQSVAVSELELRTLFDIESEPAAEAAPPQTRVFGRSDADQRGWEALSAPFFAKPSRARRLPSPEDVFAAEAAKPRRTRKTA